MGSALQALVEIPTCGLRCAGPVFATLLTLLLLTSVGMFLLLGGLDIGLQRWLFRREMRMTKSEQKRERKESDGDPMIRQHRLRDHRTSSRSKTGLRNATFIVRSADTVLAMRYAVPDAMVLFWWREARKKVLSSCWTKPSPSIYPSCSMQTRLRLSDRGSR
jgi:type III secretion protein U